MSFLDKIKDIMSATDDDDDYDEVDVSSSSSGAQSSANIYQRDPYQSQKTPEREKTTQFPTDRKAVRTGTQMKTASQIQVALVKPERFEDAKTIANHLAEGHTVVVNLEATARDIQRRLIDFLSGVTYAHKGNIKRVANSTFIITPNNVDVMGELLLDEIESANGYGNYL